MKTLLLIILFSHNALAQCGTERWDVKTLTDKDTSSIRFDKIVQRTVSDLRTLKAPNRPKSRTKEERVVVSLKTIIIKCGYEADGDYHLVLSDSGKTIIAEIPNPLCSTINKKYSKQWSKCRAFIDSKISVTRKFKKCNIPVTITGLQFFDKIHSQNGVAPNGIEIHPVLSIQ